MVPVEKDRMVRSEAGLDELLKEPRAGVELREGVREGLRDIRFRQESEGRLRDDPNRTLCAEEERRKVGELAPRVRRGGVQEPAIGQDDLQRDDGVAEAAATNPPEARRARVDGPADRAADRIRGHMRKDESLRLHVALETFPRRAGF